MRPTFHVRTIVVASLALAGAVALLPLARSQLPPASTIPAAPSYVPIGVASSGSGSTAWFHDPSTRQAVACTSGASGISCKTAKLP